MAIVFYGNLISLFLVPALEDNGLSVASLENAGKFLRANLYRAAHELRNIVTFHKLTVIVCIGLREFKWLAALAVGTDMSDKRTGIATIVAPTAENHPAPVARPCAVTHRIFRVDFSHVAGDALPEICAIAV